MATLALPKQVGKKKAKGVPKRTGKDRRSGKSARIHLNVLRHKLSRIVKSSGLKEAANYASRFECSGLLVGLFRYKKAKAAAAAAADDVSAS